MAHKTLKSQYRVGDPVVLISIPFGGHTINLKEGDVGVVHAIVQNEIRYEDVDQYDENGWTVCVKWHKPEQYHGHPEDNTWWVRDDEIMLTHRLPDMDEDES